MAGTTALSNTLDSKELESISPAVKYKLEVAFGSKITEAEELKSKYEKLRVNSEQQYFELEKQLINTNSMLETETSAKSSLETRLAQLDKEHAEAKTRLEGQDAEIGGLRTEKLELSNANQLLQAEKRDLNSFLEKREKDIQRLKDDYTEVTEKMAATNKEKCNAQADLMKAQSANVSRQYHEKRLQQERDQLQKQVEWLNTQLSDKTKEFVTFRREKASKLHELQGSLEEKTEEIKHLQATIEALKSSKEEQMTKIESLAQKLKEARDIQTSTDEQYRQELAAQTRLVNLYKTSSEDNNKKITELTRAVEELQKLLKEANNAYTELEASKAEEVEKLGDEIREGELKIDSLEQELRNANDLLAAKKSGSFTVSQDELETMYPAAAATSKLLKSGMTLTQIYSEYVQAVENLEAQKEDNKRLNSYLEQILQEIEDKAPQLKKQREDYEAALQALDQLTPQLDAAMLECEKLRSESEEQKRRTSYFQRENSRTQQRNIDLSRQVKFLLKEIQELKGGCVVQDEGESEVSSSQDVTSSSRIITEKMVTFRNIEELQEKNQQLLESLRDLSKSRDEAESQATDARVVELKQQLDLAKQELEQLRSDRTRQAEMVEAIVRQRDMYRVLLHHGGSTPVSPGHPLVTSTPMPSSLPKESGQPDKAVADLEKELSEARMALKEMQAEYNTYRKEKMENEKILNEQLEKTRDSLSENRVQNAKIASQVDHAAERYKILQSNAESYRKEIAALQDKCQKYSTSVAKHELTITKLKEDVFEKQQQASIWEAKVDQLRAQYDTLRSHEQRLVAELEGMRRERQSQALLTANLQAIQNNLERAEFESKSRYTNQIDSLEKEVTMLRRKLECAQEEKATTVSALETSVKSVQAELAKAREVQDQLKSEAEKAKHEMKASLQELSVTEAKLVAAESKLSNLGTTEGLPAEEEIKDLRNEADQMKQHMKSLQNQLKASKQQADQYKAIAEGVEQNLRQSNQTSKEFQETCEAKMIEAQNAKAALEKRVEQLETDHQELLNENIRITEDSHNLNNDLRKQLASLRHELQEAIQMRESAVADQNKAQQSLQQQVELAAEAQDKYQRELMLHAADVEALTALKKQLESHNDDIAKAQSDIQAEQQKLINAQTSWQEQERVLREECKQLETRNTELEKQNATLHAQMEKLSSQAVALQQKSSDNPLNLSLSEEAGKSSDQLLEVIKFLRREKEIAETKLEVVELSSSRLQQRLTLLEKQLEDSKQALSEERQQNQASVQTMSQHMELMRKVETVNLLQESNKLLREENNRMQSQLQETDAKVRKLEEEISPLQASVRDMTAQKEVLEVEKTTLAAEVERWKSRTHHLVEQSNKTDPEEHRKLMQEKDQIRKQLAQTKEELFRAKSELSRVNNLLTNKESDLNTQRQEMNKQMEELQEVKRLLDEEQKEGEKKTTTINQLKKIGRKYKEQSEATQKELDTFKATSAGQQTQQSTAAAAAEQANKQLLDKLATAEKERDEVKAKVTQKETEMTGLKEQSDKVQRELSRQQEQVQTMQVINNSLKEENAKLQGKVTELERNVSMQQMSGKEESTKQNDKITELQKEISAQQAAKTTLIEESTKQQAEITKLQEENSKLQSESTELERKQNSTRTVLQNARSMITQQKEQINRLTAEVAELKSKGVSAPGLVSKENSDLQMATIKSQYDQQVAQLQRDLEEARQGAGSSTGGPLADQLEKEKERLATENAELHSKVQQLQRQVEMLPKATPAQPAQPMPRQTASSGTSPTSTETPKMASIKPVATAAAAPAMQHTSSQAKATASIRPMAMASSTNTVSAGLPPYPSTSSTPPIVTVMPTTMVQPEPQQDEQPSTSGLQQQTSLPAASVAGRPQQQVQIVTPQIESVEPSTSVEETTTQAVVAPSIQEPVHAVQTAQQQQPPLQPVQAQAPSTSGLASGLPRPSTSGDQSSLLFGKRTREDMETGDETEAKRSRVAPAQEAAVIPTITVMDENSKVVTQIEPQQENSGGAGVSSTVEHIREEGQNVQAEEETRNLEVAGQDDDSGDIIVVNSDEEGGEGGPEFEEGQQHELQLDEEDIDDETEEEGESEEMDEEEFEEEEEQDVEEVDEEGMPGEVAGEEDDDNDVVIIDIDESETPAAAQSQSLMEPEEDAVSGSVTTTTSSPRPPPPPLQPVSGHTERLPSTSRQLTPFLLGQSGAFDEDDCMVPSTPTLSMPRRSDGFAEALNSPHVAQRFVFSGGPEGASQPELAQLESQRALGMDDTRMDLSQFDEGGARSIPTTPVPQQASAPVSFDSLAQQAASVPAATSAGPTPAQSQEPSTVTSASSAEVTASGQGEGQSQSASSEAVEQTEEASSEVTETQQEEETEASLLEGGAGDEEEDEESSKSESTSKPRIQRIVWDAPQPASASGPSTSGASQQQQQQQHSQQQLPARGLGSRGLRRGAVPTRPSRGTAWRGGQRGARGGQSAPNPLRGMGAAMRRGGPRGGYRGQF